MASKKDASPHSYVTAVVGLSGTEAIKGKKSYVCKLFISKWRSLQPVKLHIVFNYNMVSNSFVFLDYCNILFVMVGKNTDSSTLVRFFNPAVFIHYSVFNLTSAYLFVIL